MSEPARSIPLGEIRFLGDAALVVGCTDARAARTLAASVTAAGWNGICDLVVGLQSLVVSVDPEMVNIAEIAGPLRLLVTAGEGSNAVVPLPSNVITVPVVFDGPDLDDVARSTGLSTDDVVERFLRSRFTVALVGFSPGFAYLEGLDESLCEVPRRSTPRPHVAAGSVAIAGGLAAVYPQLTPGGWQILGRTRRPMFDSAAPPYSVLSAGDRVRFERDHRPETNDPSEQVVTDEARFTDRGSAGLSVVEPGLFTTVQDHGRLGLAAVGVPKAGPADPVSHRLANALVGNPSGRAALEITAVGPTIEFLASTHIAVVGAQPTVTLDGHEVAANTVLPIAAGQVLSIGTVRDGLRSYLAVAGGVECERVMESMSTDVLSGLGPGRLQAGDVLSIGRPAGVLADHLLPGFVTTTGDGPVILRVVAGPHCEQFDGSVLDVLSGADFVVGPESDRIGVRLDADSNATVALSGSRQIASQGMVHGALQVPPDGHPVVLGCDHGTTGGYPVVAVVITADLHRLGQLGPGDRVRFAVVDHDTARLAFERQRLQLIQAVVGHYPRTVD